MSMSSSSLVLVGEPFYSEQSVYKLTKMYNGFHLESTTSNPDQMQPEKTPIVIKAMYNQASSHTEASLCQQY